MRHAWPAAALAMLCISGVAAALDLIEVHGPEGQLAYVNVAEISSLREPTKHDLAQFVRGTHCLIVTTNGKFLATTETCTALRNELVFGHPVR